MIDWDKPIETVDGRGAKVLSRGYWRNGETYCVVQVENPETGDSEILIVNPTTGYGHARMAASSTSIRNARVKREGWVNIYGVYETEEEAKRACVDLDRDCHRFVRWEE
jgi:hypothetical protein